LPSYNSLEEFYVLDFKLDAHFGSDVNALDGAFERHDFVGELLLRAAEDQPGHKWELDYENGKAVDLMRLKYRKHIDQSNKHCQPKP
jgi:hypothetical protein